MRFKAPGNRTPLKKMELPVVNHPDYVAKISENSIFPIKKFSSLADYLLKKTNWKIYGACRWRSPIDNIHHLSNLINQGKKIELSYLDLTDYSSVYECLKKIKPDYIFHLAAQSFPKASFDLRDVTYNTNILGTFVLLDSARKLKIIIK